tara:strand:+ start:917 stop:1177 length:261 start_codon:yes stop_codon:yes gene_type:complete
LGGLVIKQISRRANSEPEPKFGGAPDQAFVAWCFVHSLATLLVDRQIKSEMVSGGSIDPIELYQQFSRFFDFSLPAGSSGSVGKSL